MVSWGLGGCWGRRKGVLKVGVEAILVLVLLFEVEVGDGHRDGVAGRILQFPGLVGDLMVVDDLRLENEEAVGELEKQRAVRQVLNPF